MKKLCWLTSLWTLTLLGPVALAAPGDGENLFTTEVVTPHVPWAKPYAKGKVRVIAIVPGRSVRSVVEIAQRLDVDLAGTVDARENDALKLVAGEWDCAVVDEAAGRFSAKLQAALLEKVMTGRGLVVLSPYAYFPPGTPPTITEDRDLLVAGVPGEAFAAWHAGIANLRKTPAGQLRPHEDPMRLIVAGWRTMRIGQGRSIQLPPLDLPMDYGYAQARFEYYMALVTRAVLWASPASRRPDVRAAGMDLPALTMDRSQATGATVSALFTNALPQTLNVTVTATLRSADGNVISRSTTKQAFPAGESSTAMKLPALLAGGYYADFIVDSKRGREAWAASYFAVTNAAGIEAITLDRDYAEIGEKLSGRVTLRAPPASATVRVDLIDNYGRTIDRQLLAQGQAGFAFTVRPDATMAVRVRATLLADNITLDWKETVAGVPRRGEGEFNNILWNTLPGPLGYWANRQLVQEGVTAILQNPDAGVAGACAMNNLMTVPYATHLSKQPVDITTDPKAAKPVSFNHDAARAAHIQKVVAGCAGNRKFGVLTYSLGDEVPTRYLDATPECQAAYRRYLKGVYGKIEALNTEWGEAFTSFDQVELLKVDGADEGEALKQGKYARWCDRQIFAHWNMLQFAKEFGQAFRAQLNDPKGTCGYEGAGGFGDDVDEILETMTYWGPYPGFGNELLRSMAPPEFLSSNWYGYDNTAEPLIREYDNMIRSGVPCTSWWRVDANDPYHPYIGFIAPAYNVHPPVRALLEETRWVREGGGKLFIHMARPHDGIALFYSPASALASSIEASSQFSSHDAAAGAWSSAITDLGYQYKFVSGKRIAEGALERDGYKVLVLPFAQAIAPAEAAAIRRFAEAGGTVIADLRPGVFTGHGRPVQPGMLDTVFGASRGSAPAEPKMVNIEAVTVAGKPLASVADPGYAIQSAKARAVVGNVPVIMENQIGKGNAVLLNFNITRYGEARRVGHESDLRRFIASLMAAAGLKPPLEATVSGGAPCAATCITRWGTPAAGEIIGVMSDSVAGREAGTPIETNIRLGRQVHVYQLKAGQYLGKMDTVQAKIVPERLEFFALWPHEIGAPKLELSKAKMGPGQKVTATISFAKAAKDDVQVVLLTAVSPKGEPARWWRQQVVVKGGVAEVPLYIAHDEEPGRWTLQARDLISGQTAEAKFTVTGTDSAQAPWPRVAQ